MALVVLGKRGYNFTKDGQTFIGVKLHCREEFPAPDVGYLTEVLSVGDRKSIYHTVLSLPFGAVITPIYDKYGKIQDIIVKSLPEEDKSENKK